MMQEEYTTVSSPECCDGYLGLMIGSALWYPLFSEGNVQTTAQHIAELVGDHARKVRDGVYRKQSIQNEKTQIVEKQPAGNMDVDDSAGELKKILIAIDGKLDKVAESLTRHDERIKNIENMLVAEPTDSSLKPSFLLKKYSFRDGSLRNES